LLVYWYGIQYRGFFAGGRARSADSNNDVIWKRFKTVLRKKLIGQKSAETLSFVQGLISVNFYRSLRNMRRPARCGVTEIPPPQKFAVNGAHTFFGYYDVTPFSKNNETLLATVVPAMNRTPHPDDSMTVGYFDVHGEGRFQPLAHTTTWCWQQGCRLQWHPQNENDLIVYNRMVHGNYGSVVQDVNTKQILRQYDRPIYDVDSAGKWAVSINFSRLQRLRRGYGYVNLPDETERVLRPDNDGVVLLDLQSGKTQMILTLNFLSTIEPLPSMEGAEHYLNHLSFSPSGNHFMFFHLWTKNGERHGRLMVCDRDGTEPRVLEDGGSVSHYCWKSDRDLLVTVNLENKLCRYNLYHDLSRAHTTIGQDVLSVDGHPSYSPDRSMLLTDTYPDKYREQALLLYSAESGRIELGRFSLPFHTRGEYRCDLHPRWDRSGRYVCIDSAHEGSRALYVLDLRAILGNRNDVSSSRMTDYVRACAQ
jgi:hypothetical protein